MTNFLLFVINDIKSHKKCDYAMIIAEIIIQNMSLNWILPAKRWEVLILSMKTPLLQCKNDNIFIINKPKINNRPFIYHA